MLDDTERLWAVHLKDGVQVCVAPSLEQMTTYVLLEQEDWFEAEMDFVRAYTTETTRALDIGANHGVYGLTIAARATQGQVIAFEPTRQTGQRLLRSIELNGFAGRMRWVGAAVSNRSGEMWMSTSLNSELSVLGGEGAQKEKVEVVTLDGFLARTEDGKGFDFVKLDVEGEEARVLAGGQEFFSRQSPLVMFELKHGSVVNAGLIEAFRALGYGIFRFLPGANALVPYDGVEEPFLLNLFACKPDRAAQLRERGLLLETSAGKAPQTVSVEGVSIERLPFAAPFLNRWASTQAEWLPVYRNALIATLAMKIPTIAAEQRLALAQVALAATDRLVGRPEGVDPGVWITRVTLLDWLGQRAMAVGAARKLYEALLRGEEPAWPFVPPLDDFANRRPTQSPNHWLIACLGEFIERRGSFSSYFIPPTPLLNTLLKNPNRSLSLERRALLAAFRRGERPALPANHPLLDARHCANALIWQELRYGTLWRSLYKPEAPIEVLDVGAASFGKYTEPYAPLLLLGCARVTGFEPDNQECQRLEAIYGKEGPYRFIPAFVGLGGEATFHQTNWSMTGSLYRPNTALLEVFENLPELTSLVATHPVQTVRLADLEAIRDVDLLKIDIQGAELDVFRGAGALLERALVIWTEVKFLPLYEGQPLFAEVESFLRQRGFLFHSFDGIATRGFQPYASLPRQRQGRRRQQLWADAIFVRDFRRWQELDEEKLAKLAVLLDLVLEAPDLCYRALSLIDTRRGTQYASAYGA